jgi:uncharacterized membrane protein
VIPFLTLLIVTLVLRGAGASGLPVLDSWITSLRGGLAAMFLLTASAHWGKRRPDLIRMVPTMFPRPDVIVTVTGVLELLGAIGLLFPPAAPVAAVCLAALLMAMFPANVRAALQNLTIGGKAATGLPLRLALQVIFIAALLVAGFPDFWAVSFAPAKSASVSRSESAKTADALFWDVFHGGRYEEVPRVLDALTAAYIEDPRDARTAAHIGFSHLWRLSEQARLDTQSATITDELVLARKYFSEAVRLAPDDARFQGFLASMELGEGAIHGDERLKRRGYFDLLKARDAWPEFNLFTAGYVLSQLPHTDSKYAAAVAYQWQNLDVCAEDRVDRVTVAYDKYMAKETTTGRKRPCWNSSIAPHNFEGFFLNMGDMLVKQGDPETARRAYSNAKLSKTYQTWPFKNILEERIVQADENIVRFRSVVDDHPGQAGREHQPERIRTMMISSTFACMGCHQR